MRIFGIIGLALAAALVLAVPAARTDTGDAWLTTKVKIALLTADGVSASAVNVDSQEGNVTIHGKVTTADEKAKAEASQRARSTASRKCRTSCRWCRKPRRTW